MKIQFRQIEQFVKSPDKAARVILIYGPDNGLISERFETIGKTIVKDINDPFNVASLSTSILLEDPARLTDEAKAISMMGGDRLIKIDDGSDKITTILKEYLKDPSETSLILIKAGELSPRSSLRKLCENEKNAAAIPCYIEDERDVLKFIKDKIQNENLKIDNDAIIWLAANISGDRRKIRSELEKLIIYKGEDKNPISIDDVKNACGSSAIQNFDNLVYNIAGRNSIKALMAYETLISEGVAFIAILRSIQNHFRRIHICKSYVIDGMDIDSAMKKLSPPVFFKQAPMFKSQVNSWSLASLEQIISKLNKLEAQCKKTAMPAQTLCSQAILAISKMKKIDR